MSLSLKCHTYIFILLCEISILSLCLKCQSYHPILMSEISILLFYSYARNINPVFIFEIPILFSSPNVRNTNPIILSLCQKYQSYYPYVRNIIRVCKFEMLMLRGILMCEISMKSSYLNVRNINSIILSLCQKYQSYHPILMSEISILSLN